MFTLTRTYVPLKHGQNAYREISRAWFSCRVKGFKYSKEAISPHLNAGNVSGRQSVRRNSSLNNTHSASASACLKRHVCVTGGTSGIGYSVAKQCVLERAAHVYIVGRSSERGKGSIEKMRLEIGLDNLPVTFVQCDLQETSEREKLFSSMSKVSLGSTLLSARIEADNGHHQASLDTFIHCAGISQSSILMQTKTETISSILRTNLEASIHLGAQFLKMFSKRARLDRKPSDSNTDTSPNNSFCFVNVASLLANKGGYGASAYAASKAGLIAFTRSLALEGAELRKRYQSTMPPFRANVVVPGYIDTPMIEGMITDNCGILSSNITLVTNFWQASVKTCKTDWNLRFPLEDLADPTKSQML